MYSWPLRPTHARQSMQCDQRGGRGAEQDESAAYPLFPSTRTSNLRLNRSRRVNSAKLRGTLCASTTASTMLPVQDRMPARPWQPEEDAALTSAVEKIGARNWKWVASEVKSRDHVQCAQRWLKALKPGLHKGQWKAAEDELLRKLVVAHGTDWPKVAEIWQGSSTGVRTVKQIRERWNNHVDPSINRAPFSQQEDEQILKLHRALGNSWSAIAKSLTGRRGEAVKSRFKSLTKRQLRSSEPRSAGPKKKMKCSSASSQTAADPGRCGVCVCV